MGYSTNEGYRHTITRLFSDFLMRNNYFKTVRKTLKSK